MVRKLWFTVLLILSMLAVSAPSLAVEPLASAPIVSAAQVPAQQPDKARPLGDRRPTLPPSADRVELALDALDQAPEAATAPVQVQADVNLILDDGSAERNIGLDPPSEFIYLNRFSPTPSDFAFDLDEIRVYFYGDEVTVGDDIILAVYENTSGNDNPAIGANFLASFSAQVQVKGAWSVYTLNPPVHFDGPGDVLIGVVTQKAPITGYHPAALDEGVSRQRSWAGWWNGVTPDPPLLPPDNWTRIDGAGYPGNWLIRGYGTLATQTLRVELLPEHQVGRGDPTDTLTYDVTVRNYTGQTDMFDITFSGQTWSVSGPTTIGPLANQAEQTFQVEITIPGDAECPDCDSVTVMAQAQSNGIYSDTASIETCVGEDWQNESSVDAQGAHWLAYTCTDAEGSQGTCFYFGGLAATNALTAYSQKYDIASGNWIRTADMPTPVFGATAGYINGKVYVAGGYTATTDPWPVTGALQIFDVASNTWSTGPDLPVPRGGVVGGVVNGKFYVANGQDETYEYIYVHEYDPVSNTWSEKAPSPDFFSFGAGVGTTDHLYIGGGYFGTAEGQNKFFEYDPTSDMWEEKAVLPGGAGKKSPVLAPGPSCEGVFLYGGDLGDWSGIQDSTWYWHPLANAWVDYGVTLNSATTGGGGGYAHGMLWSFAGSQGAGPIVPPPHESLVYCCPPGPPTGDLEGIVTDANTGLPLENANIYLTGISDPGFEDSTWTDASGYYAFGPLLVAEYEVRAAAFGYENGNANILIPGDALLVQSFALKASIPELSPVPVGVEIQVDRIQTVNLTLLNHGSGDLLFHVSELPADTVYPVPAPPKTSTGIDPQLVTELGESADSTAEFIIYMAEQADLSKAFQIQDRSARGHYVYDTLRATAERTQAGLRAELTSLGVPYEARFIVNALVAKGNMGLVESVATRPEVAYIEANRAIPAPKPVQTQPGVEGVDSVGWNIAKVQADDVWNTYGVQGEGMVVANIDTGVQWNHPALVNQYRGGPGGNHNYNWWDPYHQSQTVPYDFNGHGTHTMGTMLGDDGSGNQIGMAPEAKWFACNGFSEVTGEGYEAELLECADFVLAPWDLNGHNPNPDLRADVVNNSWGGEQAQWWYNQAIYAWQAAGIFPVFSAGNDGPDCETAGDPGDMPNILAVGALDMNDSNAPGSGAAFSSRGPADITGVLKPNVSAPGASIRSSINNGSYGYLSGTSMASPHVAGQAALIWSAQPELLGNVQLTYWIIEQTSDPLLVDQGYFCGADTSTSVPNNQYGYGRIDAYDAVQMALNENWDIPWLSVDPPGGVVAPDASKQIGLIFDTGGLTPGACYPGTLLVGYNDPDTVQAFVPLELCVAPVYINYEPVPGNLLPNDTFSYEIVIGNSGSSPVTGAVLSTTLPAEVQYLTSDPPGAYDPGEHEVVWSGLSLSTDTEMTATVDVTIAADTELCTLMESSSYLFYGAADPVSDMVLHGTKCYIYVPLIFKEG